MLKVTLMAAMDEARLIGTAGGGLPWRRIGRDQQHFRDYTEAKAMLLGRRTFEEMAGWFGSGRRPIVVTRDSSYQPLGGCSTVGSVGEGIELARVWDEGELVVAGGASIYRLALAQADELNLTLVHHRFAAVAGSAFFPEWQGLGFTEVGRERFEPDGDSPWALSFLRLRRDRPFSTVSYEV